MPRAFIIMLVSTLFLAGGTFVGRAATKSAPAPELAGGVKWLNTRGEHALTLAALRNKVLLVEFWTAGCINCLNTLPYVKQWYARYNPRGLVVVGVHSPEFRHEHAEAYVRERIKALGIHYPVVMDNDFKIWRVQQRLLADHVPDRQDRSHPLQAHRRRQLRCHRGADPKAARRTGAVDAESVRRSLRRIRPSLAGLHFARI